MRKALALLLTLALNSAAFAQFGFGFGAQPNPLPLNLPLANSGSSIFTFLGSFKVPTGNGNLNYPFGAMSINGSTLYMSSDYYDPYDANNTNIVGAGIAAVTVPALTGPPALAGANGTASVTTPQSSAQVVAPANYTASTTPSGTSVLMNSLPGGMAAGAGWYAKFTCSSSPDKLITGVSGDTISWSGSLPSGCSTTVSIHQWNPLYPFGNASGYRLTGSLSYNGNLLVTGGAYYDTACSGANLGWLVQGSASSPSWGNVYKATVNGTTETGEYSRRYAGPMGLVPGIWQSLLGGPVFVAGGVGLSGISCGIPIGFSFNVFDPSTISTAGGQASISSLQDYFYQGALGSQWNEALSSVSLSGPFPGPNGGTYYPITLTGGNGTGPNGLTGATKVTIAVPAGTVSATANVTNAGCPENSYCNLVITSISSGTISNSAIYYSVSGSGIPGSEQINPGYDQGPGNATGTGTYLLSTPGSSQTGIAVTLTPYGYGSAGFGDGFYYQMCFSDSECRTGHAVIGSGSISFPSSPGGANNADPLSFAALTCVSCTLSATISPEGDEWVNTYDGQLGTEFILPGSRSLLYVTLHQYGPHSPRADQCAGGASGSNQIPLIPDSQYYMKMQVVAYDLQDIVNAKNGIASDTNCPNPTGKVGIYAACPYGTWDFPGYSSLKTSIGCLQAGSAGWAAYDPVGGILYATFKLNVDNNLAAQAIVYEWSVTPL